MPAKSPIPLEKISSRVFEADVRLLEAIAETHSGGVSVLVRDILHAYCERVRERLQSAKGTVEPPAPV